MWRVCLGLLHAQRFTLHAATGTWRINQWQRSLRACNAVTPLATTLKLKLKLELKLELTLAVCQAAHAIAIFMAHCGFRWADVYAMVCVCVYFI